MARTSHIKNWVGRTDESMPGIHVLLRLYSKQNGLCACPDQCGRTMNFDRDKIDCDHIVPLRDGGQNIEANLQLILQEHHRIKTAAENVARGAERRHKAKAFTDMRKAKWQSQGFPARAKQRTATAPLKKRVGYFEETP